MSQTLVIEHGFVRLSCADKLLQTWQDVRLAAPCDGRGGLARIALLNGRTVDLGGPWLGRTQHAPDFAIPGNAWHFHDDMEGPARAGRPMAGADLAA